MKAIKSSTYIITLFILLVLNGCQDEFLSQEPQTSLSTDQVFESLDNVQPFLNGLYFKWKNTRVNRKGFFLMLGTDESQQGEYQVRNDADQAGLDKYDGFYEPENKPIAELWSIRWPVVVQSMEAIEKLNSFQAVNAEDSARIDSYLGQAKFYKAAVLFELASYWGALPIPKINGEEIIISSRNTLEETYKIIEADLTEAILLLSENRSTDQRIPTSWAAKSLLGKLYMSAPVFTGLRDFQKAKTTFQDIVNRGGFSLTQNFSDLWDPNRSPGNEPVYTFLFNNVWPDTNEAQWYTGSRAASGNPTNYIGGYDLVLPTEYSRTEISMGGLWEPGDNRQNESIRYMFINGNNYPSPFAGFGDDQLWPHIKKYEDKRIDGIQSFYESGKNMYYLRYADILLSLAECMNETGETANAVNLINNQIRRRAWGGNLPNERKWDTGISQEEFRVKIMDERMRELCFEGWRRFDLLRTGNFIPLILQRNRWAKENATLSQTHTLYPIPSIEIKLNPEINDTDQNPGYN